MHVREYSLTQCTFFEIESIHFELNPRKNKLVRFKKTNYDIVEVSEIFFHSALLLEEHTEHLHNCLALILCLIL